MRPIDWLVFVAFLAYVVWDGVRRRSAGTSLEGYYAGGRAIPWWAAGLSIMATQASAITVIGTTGEGHEHGLDFVQAYFGLPFALVLLCIFLVPYFRRRNVLTPYELLEDRFGPATRTLASLIFLSSRCLALGAVIYAPSVVLSAMIGLETWHAVVIIGALTTFYTMVGGVSAVIWTDVKQMTVILVGLFAVAYFLLRDLLPIYSFGQLLDLSGAAGKLNALEVEPEHAGLLPRTLEAAANGLGEPSFWEEKYNLWAGLFGGLFLHLSYFGCDHSQAQRLLTGKDADQSKKSLLLSAVLKVPMQGAILFLGVLMWLYYAVHGQPMLYKTVQVQRAASAEFAPRIAELQVRFDAALAERTAAMQQLAALPDGPRSDPSLLAEFQRSTTAVKSIRAEARALVGGGADTNDIFCRFILDNLPPVLLGLVIAAIFAAAMSSIDSVLNALSGVTVVDVYRRWLCPQASERAALRFGKFMTLFWGAIATGTAMFFAEGRSVVETINRVGSFFYGSLLGIFALALFVPRAGALAGFLGLCGGMLSVLVVYWTLKVEFLWFNVVGLVGVLATGGLVAWLTPRRL